MLLRIVWYFSVEAALMLNLEEEDRFLEHYISYLYHCPHRTEASEPILCLHCELYSKITPRFLGVHAFLICLTKLSVARTAGCNSGVFQQQTSVYVKYLSQQKTTVFLQDEMRHRPAKM
jgi:hypothetical protein